MTPARRRNAASIADAARAHEAGDHRTAADICERILKRSRADVNAHLLAARCYQNLFLLDEAMRHARAARRTHPAHPAVLTTLGYIHLKNADLHAAADDFRAAIEQDPDSDEATAGLSQVHLLRGETEPALELLARRIDAGARMPDLVSNFADACRRAHQPGRAVPILREALDQPGLAPARQSGLLFALGHCLDAMQEYDDAWPVIDRANRLVPGRFDPLQHRAAIGQIIRTWSRDTINSLPDTGVDASRLCLIVGLPRSGTSLVEQILASHPDVHGAGERTDLQRLVAEIEGPQPIPEFKGLALNPRNLTGDTLAGAARRYVGALTAGAGSASLITDKFPYNDHYLGIARVMLPGLRIIHCSRDPRDAGLSIYFQDFGSAATYHNNLRHIAAAAIAHDRLRLHWAHALEPAPLQVQYEELVRHPREQTERLLKYAGLEWNDACLRFHESRRATLTHSTAQVTRPMYATSIGRWRNYEPHLAPLIEALGADSP